MLLRNNFPATFDGDVDRQIRNRFENTELPYLPYFNLEADNKDAVKLDADSTFGAMPIKAEGTQIATDDPVQRFTYNLKHVTYALAFKASHEMVQDDLRRKVNGWANSLGASGAETLNVTHANILNRGFSSAYLYGDGIELFSQLHPLISGTEQNELTTPADLSTASLNEAMYTLRKTVDHRGKLQNIKAVRLIVPAELEKLAFEIITSLQASGTTDNDANFFKNRFVVVVDPFLTDVDAWFIEAVLHGLVSFTRESFNGDAYVEQSSRSLVHWRLMRFSAGVEDWRGIFGSEGA